jgi:hypothetical protein
METIPTACTVAVLTGRKAELEVLKTKVVASSVADDVKAHFTAQLDGCLNGLSDKADDTGELLEAFYGASRNSQVRGLWIENRTKNGIIVAIAYKVPGYDSIKAGQYNLGMASPDKLIVSKEFILFPGEKIKLLDENTKNKRYFVHSRSFFDKRWGGNYRFYVGSSHYDANSKTELRRVISAGYKEEAFTLVEPKNFTEYIFSIAE